MLLKSFYLTVIHKQIIQHGEDKFKIDKDLSYTDKNGKGIATNAVRKNKEEYEVITLLWEEEKAIKTGNGEVVYNCQKPSFLASRIINDGFSYARKIEE